MHLIKSIRYEGVIRNIDGSFRKRFIFNRKNRKEGYRIEEGKTYLFVPSCMSYNDRMGLIGRIRSYDYFIDSIFPIIFDKTEKDKLHSKESEIIYEILQADHVSKISAEARKSDWLTLTPKKIIIVLIILVAIIWWITRGKT